MSKSKCRREKSRLHCAAVEAHRLAKWVRATQIARKEILARFPKMPRETATEIARFASQPNSGRVFRHRPPSEGTTDWQEKIPHAVVAHIRHTMTDYDRLVWKMTKVKARKEIAPKVQEILAGWGFSTPICPSSTTSSETPA